MGKKKPQHRWVKIRGMQYLRLCDELGFSYVEDQDKLTISSPNGVWFHVHLAGGLKMRRVEKK